MAKLTILNELVKIVKIRKNLDFFCYKAFYLISNLLRYKLNFIQYKLKLFFTQFKFCGVILFRVRKILLIF